MMKRSLAIVTLVILALAIPASMLAQQDSKAEKEIRAALDQITAANLKGGDEAAAAFDKLFAEDYTRITSDGAVHNKADMLNGFRTGKTKIETLELSDIKIRIYGHTAVVTGISNSKGVLVGENIPQQTRWTRVLVKRGGTWESVLYQNTRIAEPANAQASNTAPPSYIADPAVYTLIKENDLFRVIIAKKPVGHRDAWHSHLPNTVYDLTDCDHRIYTPDGKTIQNTAKAGSTFLQPAIPSHSTENIGAAECDQLIVERK